MTRTDRILTAMTAAGIDTRETRDVIDFVLAHIDQPAVPPALTSPETVLSTRRPAEDGSYYLGPSGLTADEIRKG